LKPIVDGLAGEQWARRRKTGESNLNSEGFRETLSEERQRGPKKAKMAGKKEAKQKAGPRGQTEKKREETESSTGTKNTSKEGGQSVAQKKQPQAKREQRPEEGAQDQRRIDGKDIQEGWETIKEIQSARASGGEAGQSISSNPTGGSAREGTRTGGARRRCRLRRLRRIFRRTRGPGTPKQHGGAQESGHTGASAWGPETRRVPRRSEPIPQ